MNILRYSCSSAHGQDCAVSRPIFSASLYESSLRKVKSLLDSNSGSMAGSVMTCSCQSRRQLYISAQEQMGFSRSA